MRKVKQALAAVLTLVMVMAMVPASLAANAAQPGLSNFTKVNTYTAGTTFTDVPAGEWYAADVQTAYELGLVNGSYGLYSPNNNIQVSAALVLACRMHSIYNTGKADFVQGDPWYQVYVDYAVANGIITAGQFSDYNAFITRRDFAGVMAKALPASALAAINTVEDGAIPDVAAGSPNYEAIYTLYRAGILTGNDAAGTFTPDTYIARSGVAALVARMTNPQLRKSISLQTAMVTLYSADGRTTTVPASQVDAQLAVGWFLEPLVTMYTLDGREEAVPMSAVTAYQGVGWYLFPDYVCALADSYAWQGDFATAVDSLELVMALTEDEAEYNTYAAKRVALLSGWQATIGCPVAILGYDISYNSIGIPEVNIRYRNLTDRDIYAFETEWVCVDAYGNVTTDWPTLYNGTFVGYMESDMLYANEVATFTWTMNSNSRTASIRNYHMVRVAFSDGGVWQ